MKYINAGEILPPELLEEIQKYASGALLYIPKAEEENRWGEVSGYKKLNMKWRVDSIVFEERVESWISKINNSNPLPPIIVGYADGSFEINCNSPLFEALKRVNIEEFPIVIWITERTDYDDFRIKYKRYADFY